MKIVSIVVILFISSCQSPEKKISTIWLYTHYTGSTNAVKPNFSPTSFLLLKPDGSYTKDFGVFESGTWKLNTDKLVLYKNRQKADSYTASTDGHILRLTTREGELVNFESSPLNMDAESENPFSLSNNQWRIKAVSKENDTLLTERLLNHFKFWEAYFTWAFNNNLHSVDVRSTASLIKIYGNGFAVKPTTELPRAWINLFFDEEDCVRANQILEKEIRKNTIGWAQTDNKYKMFIGAFQQLQNNMKAPKEL